MAMNGMTRIEDLGARLLRSPFEAGDGAIAGVGELVDVVARAGVAIEHPQVRELEAAADVGEQVLLDQPDCHGNRRLDALAVRAAGVGPADRDGGYHAEPLVDVLEKHGRRNCASDRGAIRSDQAHGAVGQLRPAPAQEVDNGLQRRRGRVHQVGIGPVVLVLGIDDPVGGIDHQRELVVEQRAEPNAQPPLHQIGQLIDVGGADGGVRLDDV